MSRAMIVVVVLGLLAGVAVARLGLRGPGAAPELEHATLYREPRALPAVALVDQDGRTFGTANLEDRWTFLFFGFVNCPDVCPTTLATLAQVRATMADLPAHERPRVALVSVDPGRDTPEVLGRYVAHFDPAFAGVTGSAIAIGTLARELGVAVVLGPEDEEGNYAVDHTAAVFLVGPDARVAALFNTPHEAATIARDYRLILAAQ